MDKNLHDFYNFYKDKKVFLTGHTGFKGSWLACWLLEMGAQVYGYALLPPTNPNMFDMIKIEKNLAVHDIADIRDAQKLQEALLKSQAEIVIHMAAQPLVRDSYEIPVQTYETNVMGTINLLEAVRNAPSVKAVLCITTDKCYENKERPIGYSEDCALGGYDPYSSSKACAEIAAASWRSSFFGRKAAVATARAGNVIGGGDRAKDRLIPDCIKSLAAGKKIVLRNPRSIRPWQHVLEPLCGYLTLSKKLYEEGNTFAEAWNFGPNPDDEKPVEWVVSELCAAYGKGASYEVIQNKDAPHEASYLKLNCSKAIERLNFSPKWDLKTAILKTVEWEKALLERANMREVTRAQIEDWRRTSCRYCYASDIVTPISVQPLEDGQSLLLEFTSGEKKIYDVTPLLDFPVFAPLKNPVFFKKAKIGYGTVIWDEKIDIAPEILYNDSRLGENQLSV